MQSLLRYPGGKTKKSVKQKLFNKFPKKHAEFREAFVGGGGVFFDVFTPIRWINDVDPDLISVYLALRDRPEEFIAKCREIEPEKPGEPLTSARPGGKPMYNARLKEHFDRLLADPKADPALKYFFVNRTVWAGRVNYDIESRLYFSNPSGWNILKTNRLEEAAKHLKDVTITVGTYHAILESIGDDVLIYCDPPYYVNTNLDRNSQLYKFGFTKEDHIEFRDAVKACKHKVIISYDDDDEGFIRGLFSDFNIYAENWTYCGTSSADGQAKTKKTGKELIITNYD